MSVEKLRCEVCGIKGRKDRWFKEPVYDDNGQLKNVPYGERGVIVTVKKYSFFPMLRELKTWGMGIDV